MKIKRLVIMMMIVLLTFISLVIFAFRYEGKTENDLPAVNDIAQSLAKDWDRLQDKVLPGLNYKIDYLVLDNENRFVKATRNGLNNCDSLSE